MAIREDKTRLNFVIEKEMKSKLQEQAKIEGRSLANLINKVLKDYLDKEEKK